MLLALVLSSVGHVWGIGVKKEITLPSTNLASGAGNANWNASSKTLTWTSNSNNVIDFYTNQNMTGFDGVVLNVTSATGKYRCLVKTNGSSTYFQKVLEGTGTKIVLFSEFTERYDSNSKLPTSDLSNLTIAITGDDASGSAVISNFYWHKNFEWDSNGQITITPQYMTPDAAVAVNGNNVSFKSQYSNISVYFDEPVADFKNKVTSVTFNYSGDGGYGKWYGNAKSDNGDTQTYSEIANPVTRLFLTAFDNCSAESPKTISNVSFVLKGGKKVTFSAPSAWGADPNKNTQSGTNTLMISAVNKTTGQPINTEAYVNYGDEVEFTAYQYSDNTQQGLVGKGRLVLNGWKINGASELDQTNIPDGGIVWYDATSKYSCTVYDDIDVKANYSLSYVCKQDATEHGNATLKVGSTNTVNNDGSYASFRLNSTITATATPEAGYVIDHWVAKLLDGNGNVVKTIENAGTTNEISFNVKNNFVANDGYDIRITPIFKETVKYVGQPRCDHYEYDDKGEHKTHNGDNYFDIKQLNAGPGITIGAASAGEGRKVTVPKAGGYMSFVFDNTYNMSDLSKWTISANTALRARVNNVEFLDGENSVANLYRDAGDRTSIDQDTKNKLKKVSEIRIHFKASSNENPYNETENYDFEWICFSYYHADRVTPTLTNGTAAEMTIDRTQPLILSNVPGYWRQYSDDTYSTILDKNDAPTDVKRFIKGDEWLRDYRIENLASNQCGDYYFGARDGGDCALGYHHETELVKVHVKVEDEHMTYVGDKGFVDLTYKITSDNIPATQGGVATVKFNNMRYSDKHRTSDEAGGSEDGCGGDILCRELKENRPNDDPYTFTITPPDGYRINKVIVTLGCHDKDQSKDNTLSFNYGKFASSNGTNKIEWVNTTTDNGIRAAIPADEPDKGKYYQNNLHIVKIQVELSDVSVINESRQITVDGETRDYWIYVPQAVKNKSKSHVPVVFALHGGSEDYQPNHSGQLNFNSLADANGFIVVYPRGKERVFPKFNPNPARAWLCTGGVNEDTKYLEAIRAKLEAETEEFTIDKNKVYMAGFSNGGMMAYAMANLMPNKFAAFASISGFPMNETHLRHHGDRPVPFLHVHGTKDSFVTYSLMPSIIDNMVARNGLSYTPTSTSEGAATVWGDGATRYFKYVYGNESDKTATPYIYYQVGTGFTQSDTGMGHNNWCKIGDDDIQKVMWDFFYNRSLETNQTSKNEFAPQINTDKSAGNISVLREHGWTIGEKSGWFDSNAFLLSYGESGGYKDANKNVYHSIQLGEGTHYLNFTATNTVADKYVNVRLVKIGNLEPFNTVNGNEVVTPSFTELNEEVFNLNCLVGEISIKFETTGIGEYKLYMLKGNGSDATTISNLVISTEGSGTYSEPENIASTDFDGYYNYNNRLFAQWNFDLCDAKRFDVTKLNLSKWTPDYSNTDTGNADVKYGTVVYTYNQPLGNGNATDYSNNGYAELTYEGSTIIPVSAGLRFQSPADNVKIQVTYVDGVQTKTQLIVNQNVKLLVPYVENSFRSDDDENRAAAQPNADNNASFENCMHHIKRDILYVGLAEGSVWDEWANNQLTAKAHVKNVWIDNSNLELFNKGGEEHVNGHHYYKMNYTGKSGDPCVVQFTTTTTIDRLGVNRNLIYSFYTEYMNELGQAKPYPGMRIVGTPDGLKVANNGPSGRTQGAIAMTYGGWTYEPYEPYDAASSPYNSTAKITDEWDELGVFNGQATENKGSYNTGDDVFVTFKDMGDVPASNVKAAIDGFPVISRSIAPAKSESLMPSTTTNNIYHPANEGNMRIGNYVPNITPWSLPARGAYAKYEVSYPGVLNADVVMMGGEKYYIMDEFGKPITQEVFCRTAQGSSNKVTKTTLASETFYKVEKTDYAKLSFNAYPGKTYYIFSNTTGMGVTGFYFEPFVYRPVGGSEFERIDVGVEELTLSQDAAFDMSSISTTRTDHLDSPGSSTGYDIYYSKDAVKVTLNRSFEEGKWNSICVPYSISKVQMEQVFGEGTEVILLRDIQKGHNGYGLTTANFITHVNQDIIAGYPYFIRPTKPVSKVETYACLNEEAPLMNSIKSEGVNTADNTPLGGLSGYRFIGTYNNGLTMKQGSYYLNGNGELCMASQDYTMKGYRAWLEYNYQDPDPVTAKILKALVNDDEEIDILQTTDIDDVNFDDVISENGTLSTVSNIYSVSGQLIRANASSTEGLPQGVYVVNGKKIIVK